MKFSIYWGQKETIYDACRINGTCGSKEVGRLQLCEGGKREPSFLGRVHPLDIMS